MAQPGPLGAHSPVDPGRGSRSEASSQQTALCQAGGEGVGHEAAEKLPRGSRGQGWRDDTGETSGQDEVDEDLGGLVVSPSSSSGPLPSGLCLHPQAPFPTIQAAGRASWALQQSWVSQATALNLASILNLPPLGPATFAGRAGFHRLGHSCAAHGARKILPPPGLRGNGPPGRWLPRDGLTGRLALLSLPSSLTAQPPPWALCPGPCSQLAEH